MKRYPSTIMATCVVPWTESYELDEERFRACIRRHLTGLTDNLYIFGTAGEGYAVNDRQFDQVARLFWNEMQAGDGRALLGVISLSLSTIVERIELGRDIGYREFQLSFPSWSPLSDTEVSAFFRETCDRFPDCKFLHYNSTAAKRRLTGDDYARLAAAHPNLVAVKTGGSRDHDEIVAMLTKAPELQFFLSGPSYAAVRDDVECGWLISAGATNHAAARRLFAARGDELRAMAGGLDRILEALFTSVGEGTWVDAVYDKVHAPDFPLRLLPPYTAGTEEMFARFRELMPAGWLPDAG